METNIIINNLSWTIKEVPTRDRNLIINEEQCYGVCNYYENTIYIDQSLKRGKKLITLTHELTHAFINSYLIENKESYSEENICDFVATYGCEIIEKINRYMNITSYK